MLQRYVSKHPTYILLSPYLVYLLSLFTNYVDNYEIPLKYLFEKIQLCDVVL